MLKQITPKIKSYFRTRVISSLWTSFVAVNVLPQRHRCVWSRPTVLWNCGKECSFKVANLELSSPGVWKHMWLLRLSKWLNFRLHSKLFYAVSTPHPILGSIVSLNIWSSISPQSHARESWCASTQGFQLYCMHQMCCSAVSTTDNTRPRALWFRLVEGLFYSYRLPLVVWDYYRWNQWCGNSNYTHYNWKQTVAQIFFSPSIQVYNISSFPREKCMREVSFVLSFEKVLPGHFLLVPEDSIYELLLQWESGAYRCSTLPNVPH